MALALFFLFLSEPVKFTVPLKAPIRVRADLVFLSVILPGRKRKKQKTKRPGKPRQKREKREDLLLALLRAASYLRKRIDVTVFLPKRENDTFFDNFDNNIRQNAYHDAPKSALFGFFALLFRTFVPVERPDYEGYPAPVVTVDTAVFHLFCALAVFAFSSIGRKIKKVFG